VTGQETQTGDWGTNQVSLALIQSNQVAHLQRFADTVAVLGDLAAKELAQGRFSAADEQFLNDLAQKVSLGYGHFRYTGWYPRLFYRTIYWENINGDFDLTYGAGANDALVADVHTDVPKIDDPGSVLHEGIGRVNLLMMAVDNGSDHFVCAGPVLSHYEFEVIGAPRRISDEEWQGIRGGSFPGDVPEASVEGLAPPVWTRSYLVPAQ
jgi:hypothetical protein